MAKYIEREALLHDIEQSVVYTARGKITSAEMRGAHKIIERIKCAPAVEPIYIRKPTKTNVDRIRSMSDTELAEFLTHINPTNCQNCTFSHGWRCQPDRDDYSDFEKCKEGRKRWLQQPAKEG